MFALFGASADTHNPHFLTCLSPNDDAQLEAIGVRPAKAVLIVLDSFRPSDDLLNYCSCNTDRRPGMVQEHGINDPASAYVPVFFYTYIHIQTVILVGIFTSICTYVTDDIPLLICHMHISYPIQTDMILIQTYMNTII